MPENPAQNRVPDANTRADRRKLFTQVMQRENRRSGTLRHLCYVLA